MGPRLAGVRFQGRLLLPPNDFFLHKSSKYERLTPTRTPAQPCPIFPTPPARSPSAVTQKTSTFSRPPSLASLLRHQSLGPPFGDPGPPSLRLSALSSPAFLPLQAASAGQNRSWSPLTCTTSRGRRRAAESSDHPYLGFRGATRSALATHQGAGGAR